MWLGLTPFLCPQPEAFTDQVLYKGSWLEKRKHLLEGKISCSISAMPPAAGEPPPLGTAPLPPPPPDGAASSASGQLTFFVEFSAGIDISAIVTVISSADGKGLRVM